MSSRFIMTAFGQDRPGIVADVTRLLYDNGCNLEDTSMTLLADEFTLILLFTCPQPQVEETLQRECRRLEKERGLSAFLRPLPADRGRRSAPGEARVLHVEGEDQAGIVYHLSRFLVDLGVNIVDLKSRVRAAPGSGTPIYVMDLHVRLPPQTPIAELLKGLAAVADELNVDVTLEE